MSWLQLRIISTPENAAEIDRVMTHLGALSITFQDNADQPIFEPEIGETPLWSNTRVVGLFHADINTTQVGKEACARLNITTEKLHWHVLEDKDWERQWMSQYQPIQCSDRFWICPSWTPAPDPSAINLKLDPGLAFGTGTHPTTFLCLQWLAQQKINGISAVDYGCGSGILGIAALLLGAANVQGVDIDPQALIATQDNVARNGLCADTFPVCLPPDCPKNPVSLVLANILAGPLVELAPILVGLLESGGRICLSGVLESQQDAIKHAYEEHIVFSPGTEKDGWICLTGTKK